MKKRVCFSRLPDNGCVVCRSCLKCPLSFCIEDLKDGMLKLKEIEILGEELKQRGIGLEEYRRRGWVIKELSRSY